MHASTSSAADRFERWGWTVLALALATLSPVPARAATFTVYNTNDSGAGSLRQAILSANATTGQDAIQFAISLPAGAIATITPLTPLPDITEAVSLVGYTQSGSAKNSLATGFNAVLRIRLSGAAAGPAASGLVIKAVGVIVDGLIIDGFGGSAIQVLAGGASSSITISGCVLGKGYGTLPLAGNTRGVSVEGVPNVRAGGTVAEDRNLIAGNQQEGVLVTGAGATNISINGNRIGLNDAGTAEGNRYGVRVTGGSVSIGSHTGLAGNVIAASAEADVQIEGGSFGIYGNRIGTDDAGLASRGSTVGVLVIGATGGTIGVPGAPTATGRNVIVASSRAIELRQSSGVTVANNYVCRNASGAAIGTCGVGIRLQGGGGDTIGGTYLSGGSRFGQGNVVANCGIGLEVTGRLKWVVEANTFEDNGVGVLVDGSSDGVIGSEFDTALGASLGNTIRRNGSGSAPPRGGIVIVNSTRIAILRNAISDNTPLGIDLGGDGVTVNDYQDADTGPNNRQNFPTLLRVTVGTSTLVEGVFAGIAAVRSHRLQFFGSTALNSSGIAEGQLYLGETTVTTDAIGHASVAATLPAVAAGTILTATATLLDGATPTDTSEFSPGVSAAAPAVPTITGVTPATGPTSGGTALTVTGTNFVITFTNVTVGGVAATGVLVASPTSLVATTPPHAAGAVDVAVTTPAGTATRASGFTYTAAPPPPPTLASITPTTGPVAGGTAVTLTGTNFTAGASVTLGGAPATSVVVVNSTRMTAITPSHAAGPVNVTVTTIEWPAAPATLANGFTYSTAPTDTPLMVALNRLRAASLEPLEVEFENGLPVHVAGRVPAGTSSEQPWARATRFLDEYRDLYQIVSDGSVRFRPTRQHIDTDGTAHVFLEQLREGVPVLDAGIALHFRGNDFTSSSGRWVSSRSPWYRASPDTVPALPFQAAFARAVQHVGGGSQDPMDLVGKPGLVHYWPELDHDGTWTPPPASPAGIMNPENLPRLAWRLALSAPGGPWDVVVDATDGSILEATTRQHTSLDLEIFNVHGGTSDICFSSPLSPSHTLWFTEEGQQVRDDALDDDGDGVNANALIREVYRHFRDQHGRDSYDDDGGQIEIFVNYGHEGNAYGGEYCLMFADEWVRRDVVAHEFTHGITDTTAELVYRREPGAINEHMSDFFGAMLDGNWLVGEELPGDGGDCGLVLFPGTLRNMANPPSCTDNDGDPFPDHVDPALDGGGVGQRVLAPWNDPDDDNDQGWVHVNSSILNKAAFLVSQGGTHNGQTIAPLGPSATAEIWFRTLTRYLGSRSHFADFRREARAAARHFHGLASPQECQVTNAFASVGIGAPDTDCDGRDDESEEDDDGDFVPDARDNCPLDPNPDQANADGVGPGDVCDPDADNDGLLNDADNCSLASNPDQHDVDGDGFGDVCDDSDADLIMDSSDNCRLTPNRDQVDTDGDGRGDACDADIDGDGVSNQHDNCPLRANANQANADGDSAGDACDNCRDVVNDNQANNDGDKWGDACDDDDDDDGVPDARDVCQFTFDPQQVDKNRNGIGLACDRDEAFLLGGEYPWDELEFVFLTDSPVDIPVFPCVDDDCPGGGEPFAAGQQYTLRLGGTQAVDARIVDQAGRIVARGVRGAEGQTLTFEVAPAFRAASRAIAQTTAAGRAWIGAAAVDPAHAWAPGPDEPAYFLQLRPLASSLVGQTVTLAVSAGLHAGPDSDADGVPDNVDSCVTVANRDQADADGDGLGDACDNCPAAANGPARPIGGASAQADTDGDTTGDACDLPRYLAEGATSAFFDVRLALLNPTTTTQHVAVRYERADGTIVDVDQTLAATSRATLDPAMLSGFEAAEFSITVESAGPVLVDRTMSWDAAGYGSHLETALLAPALTWYLAEGATHSGFELFYLLQNPNASQGAEVEVTFLRPGGLGPLVRSYSVGPHSRFNIWVDTIDELAATDVSAALRVTNGVPIIVERAMYLSGHGRFFDAGHESAGVTAPATSWFLAEGATGPFFDLFVLLANPSTLPARVRATYLLPSGQTLTREYDVAPQSRFNIWVDREDPALADTAVSTTVDSLNRVPIIVERAMWWGDGGGWYEAHNSPGATATGTSWGLAEGEVGGTRNAATYVLIANTSREEATVRARLFFEDGTTAERSFGVAAHCRFNVDVGAEFPEARDRRFGAVIDSLGDPPARIVVERAMYWSVGSDFWAAGGNALATRLR
jgi:Zn-dependent metalloprotease